MFTEQAFDRESGLMNRNLKIDRSAAYARYRDQLLPDQQAAE